MKRLLIIIPLVSLLAGCAPSTHYRRESGFATDAQRKAAAEFEQRAIADLRVTAISGHDQDWDDTLAQIHRQAVALHGTEFIVEYLYYPAGSSHVPTGRRWPIAEFNLSQAQATASK